MHKYKLKDLQGHCFDLSYFCIYNYHQQQEAVFFKTAAEWLRMASRLKNVQLVSHSTERTRTDSDDLFQYLRQGNVRGGADHVMNLTLFCFIWAAYDLITTDLQVNPHEYKVVEYLSNYYEPHKNLIGFNGLVRNLKKQLRHSAVFKSQKYPSPIAKSGRSARGIRIISEIRKFFAHLQEQFPVGMDSQEKNSIEEKIIRISSRLTLLTLQMVLLGFFKEEHEYLNYWWRSQKSRERTATHTFLRTVHLQTL